MKKIYVGCSLYNADSQFRNQVEELKNLLRQDLEVLEFLGTENVTPEDVVDTDLAQVRACDLFVAICDKPSIGLGIEIGQANELLKPTLLFAKSEDVSRMVRGNHRKNPNSRFLIYRDFEHIREVVLQQLLGGTPNQAITI